MSQVMHSLVGYDRKTERVAEEIDVPDAALPRAKQLARVLDDDPEAMRCYSLDAAGARDLAALLHARIDPDRNDYFLEGFSGEVEAYEFADHAEFRPAGQSLPADGSLTSVKNEWTVWIHNDLAKDHVEVIVTRTTLDGYAIGHGHNDHRAVVDSLNRKIRSRVAQAINRAIAEGRATATERVERDHTFGHLELTERDLAAMLGA